VFVAEFADVARAQTPGLAGDDSRRHLASGHDGAMVVLHLGAALGKAGERNDGIGGVQAHANNINLGRGSH
jgi:hypothetical protein